MNDDCVARDARLSALLDGRLTAAEAEECAEHLAHCERCRRAWERLGATRALLRGLPPPETPAELLPAILSRAERELADERAAVEVLHSLPMPRPPRELLPAIAAAAEIELRRQRTAQLFWGRWRVASVAIAAAAAVLLAVFLPRSLTPLPEAEHPLPAVTPGPEIAVLPADEPPPATVVAGLASVAPAGTPSRPVARRSSAPAAGRAHEATTATPPAPTASSEPVLAMAPIAAAGDVLSTTTPIAPGDAAAREAHAPTPRNTLADTEVGAPALAQVSNLESDLAAGIIARMVVDKFVSEHLIESAPTLLAVVTDTPSALLGVASAADREDTGFSLCFTESMRQALSASENQIR